MKSKSVDLVATLEIIKGQLGLSTALCSKSMASAKFRVNPDNCRTKLGRWLADNICTTRFDDDFSNLNLVLDVSNAELEAKELAELIKDTKIRDREAWDDLGVHINAFIEKRKQVIDMHGENCFALKTIQFAWPVYGCKTVAEAKTPEEYFDKCASMIRRLSPIKVYTHATCVPDCIQRTIR